MHVTVRALLRACHPEPTVAVTTVATLLAVAAGRDATEVAAVTVAVLAGQLSVGWSNDWFDATRDRLVDRADKPVARGLLPVRTVATAAVVAGCLTVPLSLLSGWVGSLHVLAVAGAWSYNRPLKSTPMSVLPYLVSFGLLAVFAVGRPPPWWLVTAAALLGGAAHFANVLDDLDDDARGGVRGLPHRLGGTTSRFATVGLLVAVTAVLGLGPPGPPSRFGLGVLTVTGCVLAVGSLRSGAPRSGALFRAVMVVALLDVVLLLVTGAEG